MRKVLRLQLKTRNTIEHINEDKMIIFVGKFEIIMIAKSRKQDNWFFPSYKCFILINAKENIQVVKISKFHLLYAVFNNQPYIIKYLNIYKIKRGVV